jgi:hypothetical protein
MQPNAHISTLLLKTGLSVPNNSGALYPLVPLAYNVVSSRVAVPSAVIPRSAIFHLSSFLEYRTLVFSCFLERGNYCFEVSSLGELPRVHEYIEGHVQLAP